MLAGLAVAAACSLGAATLPVGAAAAAQAAPVVEVTPAAPESSWSLIPPALRVAPHAVPEPGDRPADAALALIGSAALDPARVTARSAVLPAVRASGDAAGGDLATGAGRRCRSASASRWQLRGTWSSRSPETGSGRGSARRPSAPGHRRSADRPRATSRGRPPPNLTPAPHPTAARWRPYRSCLAASGVRPSPPPHRSCEVPTMPQTVLYQFLIEVPQAAAIWSGLLVLALAVLAALVARPERENPAEAGPVPDARRRGGGPPWPTCAGTPRRWRWPPPGPRRPPADGGSSGWRPTTRSSGPGGRTTRRRAAARRFAGAAGAARAAYPADPRRVRRPGAVAAPRRDGGALAGRAVRRGSSPTCFAHRQRVGSAPAPGGAGDLLARVVRDGAAGRLPPAAERERAAWRDAELAAEAARALADEAYAAAAGAAARPGPGAPRAGGDPDRAAVGPAPPVAAGPRRRPGAD